MHIFILGALNISLFWSLLFVKGQQVVERQRHIALVLASRLTAGIVRGRLKRSGGFCFQWISTSLSPGWA